MKYLVILAALVAIAAAGCVTQARLDGRYKELLMQWVASHPGEQLTEEADVAIQKEALRQVEAEVAEERKEALGSVFGLVGSLSTGNWIAAAAGAVGLGMLGVKQLGKSRGSAGGGA